MSTVIVAGVDEVGRGPLAGPVVAAAVILPKKNELSGIVFRDSKQLTEKQRFRLSAEIRRISTAWFLGAASPVEVDLLNIHHATLLAMRRAIIGLSTLPDFILVDGKFLPDIKIPGRAVVGGDGLEEAISAASIVAKVYRDQYMKWIDRVFPGYAFGRHKGYPTRIHLDALQSLGPCAVHRRSFAPVKAVIS
ncbi:MAG: ribonuclease HII [Candidatus Thioglobus sp.]|nr:MAG: ribonuclease HII [Candidatus Thioglobus sp.]